MDSSVRELAFITGASTGIGSELVTGWKNKLQAIANALPAERRGKMPEPQAAR